MKLNLLFISILLSVTKLFAGVVNSGGGKAVVCYTDKSKMEIKFVKSLDLVEGQLLEKHTHAESQLKFEVQVEEFIKKIPQENPWRYQFEIWSKEVIKGIKILPTGVSLKPVDDSYEVFLYERNCEIQQLAHFLRVESVMVNGDLWSKMSNTQKAALVLHETVYYLARSWGETDSKRSRRIVSFIMSDGAQIISPTLSIPKESYMCRGESVDGKSGVKKSTTLYAYKNNQNGYDLNFLVLNGKFKLSKYVLKLPIRNFPPWAGEQLAHEGYFVDSNFEQEMTNLKIEFIQEQISAPIQFKISGSAEGYYGDSMESVTVSCLPRFLTERTNYYYFPLFESLYIPASTYVCDGDFNSRMINQYSRIPVEFAYQINENERLTLEDLRVYIKDSLGNYQEMDVRKGDVDCLTKGKRSLDPQKSFFKAGLNFSVDSKVYGASNRSKTTTSDAVLVIRLTKELSDKSLDFIVYKMPFKITRYYW